MSDLFGTSAIDDRPEDWDGLATRIAARASQRSPTGLEWLAQSHGGWLLACALVVMTLALMFLSGTGPKQLRAGGDWPQALAPTDSGARAITVSDQPPTIGALVLEKR